MRFFASLFVTTLLSFALSLFLPWWIIGVAAFLVAYFIPQGIFNTFLSAFLGLFLLWLIHAIFISTENNHLLAHKFSLLILKTDSVSLIIILTALVGGLVAGLCAISGAYSRKLLKRK